MFKFIENENVWICDCGEETFLITIFKSVYKISGKVHLSRYICDKNIGMCCDICFGIHFVCPGLNFYMHSEDDIENVVKLFNEEIQNQIDAKYEPGGEKFIECENMITGLLKIDKNIQYVFN